MIFNSNEMLICPSYIVKFPTTKIDLLDKMILTVLLNSIKDDGHIIVNEKAMGHSLGAYSERTISSRLNKLANMNFIVIKDTDKKYTKDISFGTKFIRTVDKLIKKEGL